MKPGLLRRSLLGSHAGACHPQEALLHHIQLSDGSGGIVASSANFWPLRRSTAAHRSPGSAVKISSRSGGSTIHASSDSSSSSWPGPQPACPANTRARRMAPSRRSGSSASEPMKPRSPSTSAPASSGRSNSASTITAVSATGPPTYTGSASPASHDRSGTASPTVESAGRLSTRPIAPSSVCSAIRTTVRLKFGSRRTGDARISLPRSDSAIPTLCLVAHAHGLLVLFLLGGRLLLLGGLRLDRGLLLALLG